MDEIKIFEKKEIRLVWDNEKEEWYFSVVDVVGVLAESANPRRYWSDLKRRCRPTVRKNRTVDVLTKGLYERMDQFRIN